MGCADAPARQPYKARAERPCSKQVSDDRPEPRIRTESQVRDRSPAPWRPARLPGLTWCFEGDATITRIEKDATGAVDSGAPRSTSGRFGQVPGPTC